MNENQYTSNEISIFDTFKLIKSKIRLLAIISLVALVLGAVGGVVIAMWSNTNYGTQAEFYISSANSNSYILSLLSSDRFAETLLLDKNGLDESKADTKEYKQALDLKKKIAKTYDELKDLFDKIEDNPTELANVQRVYLDAQSRYTEIYNHLILYKSAEAATILDLEKHQAKIDELEEELTDATEAKELARTNYEARILANQADDKLYEQMQDELIEDRKALEELLDVLLEDFRNDPSNLKEVHRIKETLSFEFALKKDEKLNEDKALLYANIEIKRDRKFADKILKQTAQKLPTFIEESIIPTNSAIDPTDCIYIRSLSVYSVTESVNYKNPVIFAALFGIIGLVAVFAVSCGVLVFVDRGKKNVKAEPLCDKNADAEASETDAKTAEEPVTEETEADVSVE